MAKYKIEFIGKTKGAIGISSFFRVEIEADDPKAAILKLYDTHDHIQGPRMWAVNDDGTPASRIIPDPR